MLDVALELQREKEKKRKGGCFSVAFHLSQLDFEKCYG